MSRSYTDLIKLKTFEERFKYLNLHGKVSEETFGADRIFNQLFYKSKEWKDVRNKIFVRDSRCDMALPGHDIFEHAIVHHINPITLSDIENHNYAKLFDPENLITVSKKTHNAIHYGTELYSMIEFPERKPNDTIPWR